jgi:2-oxoglutarate ferredoxin oxidoreductase subunit alpha
MQESISYLAGLELPSVVVNVVRGGPGLGSIMPSQGDYYQSTRGGGHGDYRTPVLAPFSVQEMADFVEIAWEIAFKYRTPVLIMSDGMIGQMMEKVTFGPYKERNSDEFIRENYKWAITGKSKDRERIIHKSVELDADVHEKWHYKLIERYKEIEKNEVRFEKLFCDDADLVIIAFGSAARITQKAIELAREKGHKVGMFRPITLWPFPSEEILKISDTAKRFLTIELSHGQMVDDVKLVLEGKTPVSSYNKVGGVIPTPEEILENIEKVLGE